uniref:Uncharacterized protein n=1 Tax=Trichogramma kaykai TaxID=54128 RepID=A0ABD2W1J3_9HYME
MLPFKTQEDFLFFDNKLKNDKNLCDEFVKMLKNVGGENDRSMVNNICEKVMSDEVGVMYSRKGQKVVLKRDDDLRRNEQQRLAEQQCIELQCIEKQHLAEQQHLEQQRIAIAAGGLADLPQRNVPRDNIPAGFGGP